MIIPAQEIRRIKPLEPFVERSVHPAGMSYGLSHAGYDVRIAQDVHITGGDFVLASTVERFQMPNDLIGMVHDKSSWARQGLSLFNTVIEPSWTGYLTLELVNHSRYAISIHKGMPIAQIVFMRLTESTEKPYEGKYQNQEAGPQSWRKE